MFKYQPVAKIKTSLEGGYYINNPKYVDVLIFLAGGNNLSRAYRNKNEVSNSFRSFDEELRRSIIHNTENLGKYEFDNINNEIKITFRHSDDKRNMRCKLRESGILVVNYFHLGYKSQQQEKEILEYKFDSNIKFWLNDIPSPYKGNTRFNFVE